jgi:hypothetical protein
VAPLFIGALLCVFVTRERALVLPDLRDADEFVRLIPLRKPVVER